METTGSVIVSWCFTNGKDTDILLVGKKQLGEAIEIINAFQDEEARELYLKLTTRKEK